MKLYHLLIFSIFFYSCTGPLQPARGKDSDNESWKTSDSSVTVNHYDPDGLADTSYTTIYRFIGGALFDSSRSVTFSNYGFGHRLLSRQEFEIHKKRKELIAEEKYIYDGMGRETTNVHARAGIEHRIEKTYDDAGFCDQLTVMTGKSKTMPVEPFAKGIPDDTTISRITNDKDGHPTKIVVFDLSGNIRAVTYNAYQNGEQTSAIEIGANGDTLSAIHFSKEGMFTKRLVKKKWNESTETTWEKNGKPYLSISHFDEFKSKHVYRYDARGNEVWSVGYR